MRGFWNIFWCLHPGRFTWNLRIRAPWKRKIISQTIIFRFYVNLRRCRRGNLVAQFRPSQKSFMLFEMPWRFRFLGKCAAKWLWIPNKTRKSTQKITQEKGSTPLNQQLNSTLLIFLKNRRLGFLFWWAFWLLCFFFVGGGTSKTSNKWHALWASPSGFQRADSNLVANMSLDMQGFGHELRSTWCVSLKETRTS